MVAAQRNGSPVLSDQRLDSAFDLAARHRVRWERKIATITQAVRGREIDEFLGPAVPVRRIDCRADERWRFRRSL